MSGPPPSTTVHNVGIESVRISEGHASGLVSKHIVPKQGEALGKMAQKASAKFRRAGSLQELAGNTFRVALRRTPDSVSRFLAAMPYPTKVRPLPLTGVMGSGLITIGTKLGSVTASILIRATSLRSYALGSQSDWPNFGCGVRSDRIFRHCKGPFVLPRR